MQRCMFQFCLILTVCGASLRADEPVAPNYQKDIQPLLKTYCLGCHDGGDDSKGGLSVLTFATLLEGGDNGPAIVAGKSGDSRLISLLTGKDKPRMPPKDSKQPTAAEIDLIKRWVDLGAKGPEAKEPATKGPAPKVATTGVPAATPAPAVASIPSIAPKSAVSAAISATAYSPDGKWLAAARHKDVVLFDAKTGTMTETLTGALHPINAVAFSPDSRLVAAGEGAAGMDGRLLIWEIGKKAPRAIMGHADSIYGVAFSPDGKLLATCSYDKLLMLWDVATGAAKHTLKHHTAAVFSVAFSRDGKTLASVAADSTLKLWNVESGERILTFTESTKGLNGVAFHPHRNEVVGVGVDKVLRVWEWTGNNGKLRKSAFAHDAPILAVAFSPDGKTIFTGSEDRRIKAWNSTTLQEHHVYEGFADWPLGLAVSPDGLRLAAGFYNGDLEVFESQTPKLVKELAQGVRRPAAMSTAAEPQPTPPAPRLDSISPRSVISGKMSTVTLNGPNVWNADQVFVSPASIEARLLPGDPKAPNRISCELKVPGDLPPSTVTLRLHTPLGSTSQKTIYVGPFAELAEKEPNDTWQTATPSTLPTTYVGAIGMKGDRDFWSFDAQAGEELVFEVLGTSLGSMLAARLTLVDEAGKTLASTVRSSHRNEVVLGHRFAKAGKYALEIEDRNFTGGGNHFYYIHAGRFGYVTEIFPLAMQGTPLSAPASTDPRLIRAKGYNLLSDTVSPSPDGATGTKSVHLDAKPSGKTHNRAVYDISNSPELVEVEPNDKPQQAQAIGAAGGVSGRIESNVEGGSDVDYFSFDAKKGARLTIEVLASRRGSPLDSVIEILTADGTPVPRHTLRAVAETYTVLRDSDSRAKGIRLQSWDDFQVNDFLMLGGELIKVQIQPLGPDEDVKFFDKGGVRLGMLDTTPEAHALNSSVYKVDVHPPGMTFPPNGMPVFTLPYRNDDGGPEFSSDSRVLFDVPADGKYVVRLKDVRNLSSHDFFYRLVVRPRDEGFRISLDPENPNVPRGGSLPVTVNANRLDGFNGPIDIRLEGLPEGITATTGRIHPDFFSCVLTLTAAADAPDPAGDAGRKLKVIGSAQIEGKSEVVMSTPMFGMHQVSLTSPPDLLVRAEPSTATIQPGEERHFTVHIERRHGFKGRVPIDVQNLPHGLRVIDVGLSGVLINEDETSRTFVVHCDPWAQPGVVTFYASPRIEARGNERHASQPILLEVKVPAAIAGK